MQDDKEIMRLANMISNCYDATIESIAKAIQTKVMQNQDEGNIVGWKTYFNALKDWANTNS